MPEHEDTEGERAREAAQNPLRTALEPTPATGRIARAWVWPAVLVAIAVIALLLFVGASG